MAWQIATLCFAAWTGLSHEHRRVPAVVGCYGFGCASLLGRPTGAPESVPPVSHGMPQQGVMAETLGDVECPLNCTDETVRDAIPRCIPALHTSGRRFDTVHAHQSKCQVKSGIRFLGVCSADPPLGRE